MGKRICSVEGCDRARDAKGFCPTHYMRWRKHGDPLVEPPTRSQIFWRSVVEEDGCWVWTRSVTNSGYGKFSGDSVVAHRFAFEDMRAEIPEGLHLDHLCRNKLCVNPWHLEVVSAAENCRRRDEALGIGSHKTECPHGHPYDDENTTHRNGRRHCKACARIRAARNRERKRSASL